MKFKIYLIEDKNIEVAKKDVSKRMKVDPKYLDYIGKEKYGDKFGYYFNITDKNHKNYKGTFAAKI